MSQVLKQVLFIFSFLFLAFFSQAQYYTPLNNNVSIAGGLGGNYTYSSHTSLVTPIIFTYDRRIDYDFEVGAYLSYVSKKYELKDNSYQDNYLIIGGRFLYYFEHPFPLSIKPYAGIMIGYNHASYNPVSETVNPEISPIAWSVYLGSRYYLFDHLGVYGEIGYGVSYITLGVCGKW